jgi:hypothetical protein
MRLGLYFVAAGLVLAGCSGGTDEPPAPPAVSAVTPDYGPMAGGTRVVITGSGLLADGAPPNRVVIGDREAPLAGAINDETLEVVIPEGAAPGATDVIVFNSNGFVQAAGVFRYSEAPAIASVAPTDIVYDVVDATVTITGSGFLDEDAGPVTVLVDGEAALDVEVVSDTTITFTAPPGEILHEPDIHVINRRGETELPEAYRYRPFEGESLMLFPRVSATTFVVFYDPESETRVELLRREGVLPVSFRTVLRNADGDYLGVDRNTNQLGTIDFRTQEFVDPIPFGSRKSEIYESTNGMLYALDRDVVAFGSVDRETGVLTPIGAGNVVCCGSFALTQDAGGALLATQSDGISTIDVTTGVRGTVRPLVPAAHVTGMRFLNGTLYATTRDNALIAIDPATGITTPVQSFAEGLTAIEIFE